MDRPTPPALGKPFTLRDRHARWLGAPLHVGSDEIAVFTSCDPGYLDHAVALVRSLEAFSPGAAVIVHLANGDNHDIRRLQDLAAGLKHTRMRLSLEDVVLDDLPAERRRAYFASMRFLRLAEVLPGLGGSVLCVDADSLFIAPIDGDFTNKPQAEICLVRRSHDDSTPMHLRVANGTVWIRPTEGAQAWLGAVAADIASYFAGDGAGWFIDQTVVAQQLEAFGRRVAALNIKTRYADWEFRQDSVMWAGKGQRKFTDLRFVLLQRMLSDQPARQALAWQLARTTLALGESQAWILDLADRAARLHTPRVALYLPRLDQPWGSATRPGSVPPALAADTLALRLHWKEFAARLANAIERRGALVDVIEVPAVQITPETIDDSGADLAVVPHRCHLDFKVGRTPVYFYMQEYFRWVFVADPRGWSAASSLYPVDVEQSASAPRGVFADYRSRLQEGRLGSKFGQANSVPRARLVAQGDIPAAEYVFFPLQIPHDQSIRYFSDWSELEVVRAVLAWSRASGVPVVFKPHPANLRSMKDFEDLVRDARAGWSTANVHDLMAHACAVFTINSGVGFEALLHGLPVVTFGRAEYDAVTVHATPVAIGDAWAQVQASTSEQRLARYQRFIDVFLGELAVDLSQPESAARRLDSLGLEIAGAAKAARPQRRLGAAAAMSATPVDSPDATAPTAAPT